MKRASYARRVRTWDADGNEGEGVMRERNGNLAWVERDDGQGEWLAPHEMEDLGDG